MGNALMVLTAFWRYTEFLKQASSGFGPLVKKANEEVTVDWNWECNNMDYSLIARKFAERMRQGIYGEELLAAAKSQINVDFLRTVLAGFRPEQSNVIFAENKSLYKADRR